MPPIRHRVRMLLLGMAIGATAVTGSDAADSWPQRLDGTQPLELSEPLDVVIVRGISRFAERELAKAPERRDARRQAAIEAQGRRWYGNHEPYAQLRSILGVSRHGHRRTYHKPVPFGNDGEPRLLFKSVVDGLLPEKSTIVSNVLHVEWSVLPGVTAEGLLLMPAGEVTGYAVAVPDASWTPEMFCGLEPGVPVASQFPRRLVERGVLVLVPTLISRDDSYAASHPIRSTNISNREIVYRMAFEMGRHIIGFEVMKIQAAVRILEQQRRDAQGRTSTSPELGGRPRLRLGMCGVGDGGQLVMCAAAVDGFMSPVGLTLVSGYFSERESVWQEPIDRNLWSQLTSFGDAEIVSMNRGPTIIEASAAPEFDGPSETRDRQADFAAPGTIRTPPLESVRREFARLQAIEADIPFDPNASLFETPGGIGPAGSSDAFNEFVDGVTRGKGKPVRRQMRVVSKYRVSAEDRQHRQMNQLVTYVQSVLHSSDKVRADLWADVDRSNPEAFAASAVKYRKMVHDEMIGRLPLPAGDVNPRSRRVIDEPTHVGYEVMLDVFPTGEEADPGVIAGGVLLLPKDLKKGERRPVVVCQHGLEGTPMDTITTDESLRAWRAYKGFSTQLVKRGFIVYAPQNPYRGMHDFRVIQRKSNPLGRSLFSYIIEQHRQTLTWLATLPWVDEDRIAFYGLSYGGKTAVRVPPLLTEEEGRSHPVYCLSICSADFNEWIRKNVSSEDRYSYVFTREYEMFEWNMGHVAGYAELASLMVPRPFMVERGHDDGVAPDEWVAWEFAKVRRLYDQLGIGDRTEIEFFNGPHTINGQGTFEFLHRHLDWPVESRAVR